MLHKEFKRINKITKSLSRSFERLYIELDGILSNQAKNYSITFKGKEFEFFYPSTKEEKDQLHIARKEYIKLILNYVASKRISELSGDEENHTEEAYELLFALAEGEDPKDHRLEASVIDELKSQVEGDDKLYGKRRPLDKESYHVKNDLNLEEEFDDGAVV